LLRIHDTSKVAVPKTEVLEQPYVKNKMVINYKTKITIHGIVGIKKWPLSCGFV
jgi:hypothetical protein